MVDPVLISASAAIARSASDTGAEERAVRSRLMERVLGPTADVVGAWLAEKAGSRLGNFGKIAAAAAGKVDPVKDGAVAPRVAMRVFDEGAYSDETIIVEYLSGVLASSRAPGGRDDRGVSWAALVARLSSDELRLHYVLYAGVRAAWHGRQGALKDICSRGLYVSTDEILVAAQWTDAEYPKGYLDAFYGLHRERLVGESFQIGTPETLKNHPGFTDRSRFSDHGFIFYPTRPGIGLFMWAFGFGDRYLDEFISDSLKPTLTADWEHTPGVPKVLLPEDPPSATAGGAS